MQLNSLIRRFLLPFALTAGILFLPLAQAQNATGHYTLDDVQPSETFGKIEVLEFFAYTCPHCKTMEPMVEEWSSTLLGDVSFQRVPVAFNANMADLQKLYYTLENMDRLDLHSEVFKAIHDQNQRIFNEKAIIDWAADQDLDTQHFADVFRSFGIQARVARANELIQNYRIESTPSIAVGGRYVTSPALANGYRASLEEANRLIDLTREQGGQP
ncbi:MAG TPA: thiol:disulfide interchange protein DsbA/DsbL [Burkholderiaceae bacterium]|nr:thiol:disulfide interchange protein DsbA/DsbL [Burkholderiaceae bacterium]